MTARRGLLLAAMASVAGCVSEGPPPPKPLPPPPLQPAGMVPDRILLGAPALPDDIDRDGYGDTWKVTVYLFATGYEMPLDLPGTFQFRLRPPEGEDLAVWTFDEAQVAAARNRFLAGVGYIFELSLLRQRDDEFPRVMATLECRFTPTGGEPVDLFPAPSVRAGRLR